MQLNEYRDGCYGILVGDYEDRFLGMCFCSLSKFPNTVLSLSKKCRKITNCILTYVFCSNCYNIVAVCLRLIQFPIFVNRNAFFGLRLLLRI